MEPIGGNIAGRAIPKGAPRRRSTLYRLAGSPKAELDEDTEGRALPYEGLGTENVEDAHR